MAERDLIIRAAQPSESAEMAQVERACWPSDLAADADQIASRIEVFAAGQLISEIGGRIVATASAQRITETFLAAHGHRYDSITDAGRFANSHDSAGEVYQLIAVSVLHDFRGWQLGRRLINAHIAEARGVAGISRIVGFTRPIRYHRQRDLSLDEYVRQCVAGSLFDPVLAFHLQAGARVVSVHPDFRPGDRDACNGGVLIEYPCP